MDGAMRLDDDDDARRNRARGRPTRRRRRRVDDADAVKPRVRCETRRRLWRRRVVRPRAALPADATASRDGKNPKRPRATEPRRMRRLRVADVARDVAARYAPTFFVRLAILDALSCAT